MRWQVWARPLVGGAVALNMVNFASTSATITCDSACFAKVRVCASVCVRPCVCVCVRACVRVCVLM